MSIDTLEKSFSIWCSLFDGTMHDELSFLKEILKEIRILVIEE